MDDLIYNSITDMPDDVLKGNVKVFERILSITKRSDIKTIVVAISKWKDELARRQPDSLYATKLDGPVDLVDDIGEVK